MRQEYYTQEQTFRAPEFQGLDVEGVNEQQRKAEVELEKARRYYENMEEIKGDSVFAESEIERIFLVRMREE